MTEVDFKNLKDYSLLNVKIRVICPFLFWYIEYSSDPITDPELHRPQTSILLYVIQQNLEYKVLLINSSQNVCSSRSYKNVERNFYHYYFVIITCVFFFYSVLINNCKCNVAMFFKILNLLGLTSDSYE